MGSFSYPSATRVASWIRYSAAGQNLAV